MDPAQTRSGRTNALAGETSPYLLQHACNPVDWYPWGAEALERARVEGKPILLSVGYSACHWCHVMAHESFEDAETAAVMNELFINIKVDREERPDIDRIYQNAQYLLNRRSGGWPLTMFLTHDDQVPFAGGTYFPREPRWGMPAFKDLLRHIARLYREHLPGIRDQNAAVLQALQQLQPPSGDGRPRLSPAPLHAARAELENIFDAESGGFGAAPKFPHPPMVERLLRHHAATPPSATADMQALRMATFTLRCMALGGIYDHLGGGFARYSVDAQWRIPHFEKMLYDNGPLLALYSEAWQLTGDELFRGIAIETAEWAMREMQSPEGGYYSSLDADSEGHEGRFYVWTRTEVEALLSAEEYAPFAGHYGLDRAPNFEGQWHLHVCVPIAELAARQRGSEAGIQTLIDSARTKLLKVRNQRVWPGRDEKRLTSWNALMITGMATAGRILDRPDCTASAGHALDFIRRTLWKDGKLLATYKDGRAHLNAYLDDYAFLIDAILTLLQARWCSADLEFAIALADTMIRDFEDREAGGFFFTAHDHERLIQRTKSYSDDAIPSGNAIATWVLNRLGHLLGDSRYLEASEHALHCAWMSIEQHPTAHLSMLIALEEWLQPVEIIVIRGAAAELQAWQGAVRQHYTPHRLAFAIPDAEDRLPGHLALRKPAQATLAYICRGLQCETPVECYQDFVSRIGA